MATVEDNPGKTAVQEAPGIPLPTWTTTLAERIRYIERTIP